LLLQITKEEPPPIAKLRREVPHTLAKVVSRAMAKSVEARLQSVQQLARALLTFAPGRGSVLVDRIGKLEAARRTHAAPRGVGARAAGSRPPGAQQGAAHASAADDEVLEISQVEEVIEPAPPATDEDEPTRVGFSVVRARHADDEDTATLTKPVLKKVAPKR